MKITFITSTSRWQEENIWIWKCLKVFSLSSSMSCCISSVIPMSKLLLSLKIYLLGMMIIFMWKLLTKTKILFKIFWTESLRHSKFYFSFSRQNIKDLLIRIEPIWKIIFSYSIQNLVKQSLNILNMSINLSIENG